MSSHILTNLLSTANMTIAQGAILSEGVFKFPANTFCMIYHPLPVPTVGHKYYGRVDQKVPKGSSISDSRFEYYGGDGEGKNIVFTSFGAATQGEEWHTYSNILSFPYLAGENWTLRSFAVSSSQDVYRRKHMIIDLTESFGAGNEPSKDWCDRCIPFFEGTKTIESKPLVGVNGIARPITGGYVGVNGAARKIAKGYVGVNGVAKSIWMKEDASWVMCTTIRVPSGYLGISVYVSCINGNRIIIDWGDGTISEQPTMEFNHYYSQDGEYVIKAFYPDTEQRIPMNLHLIPSGEGTSSYSTSFIANSRGHAYAATLQKPIIFKVPITGSMSPFPGQYTSEWNFLQLRFEFDDSVVCPEEMASALPVGSSKRTVTVTVYTDNTSVKNFALGKIDQYTAYTVYHLDGSVW